MEKPELYYNNALLAMLSKNRINARDVVKDYANKSEFNTNNAFLARLQDKNLPLTSGFDLNLNYLWSRVWTNCYIIAKNVSLF